MNPAWGLASTASFEHFLAEVVRAALQVVQWAALPPYPHTVVGSIEEGFAFIARYVPELDARALQIEYERRRSAFLATLGRG